MQCSTTLWWMGHVNLSQTLLSAELKLPCGVTLKNRIAKSAMSENMGTPHYLPNPALDRLYDRWAKGGTGLLISGNVMIDRTALGEPGNVVFEKGVDETALRSWAKAGTQNKTQFWVQLNHPGRQSPKFLSPSPVSPSAIALKPPLNRMFHQPRALLENEIQDIITRFGVSAKIAKNCGFTGVQIHGAHGYLVSQFLSPLSNQRTDQWGGTLQNRMRFVSSVYQSIRQAVGSDFPVSIKLNSADFQRGGFSEEESIEVVQHLSECGMDLIEISGGTYEAPEMTGKTKKASTIEREAYFLDYCEKVRKYSKSPLMLTGGFRSSKGMNEALASGACDVIGLARSIAIDPDFSNHLLTGKEVKSPVTLLTTGSKKLDKLFPLEITWYGYQLRRMGNGKNPKPNLDTRYSILSSIWDLGCKSLRRTRG